mmetsp:Transcript_8719/g.21521  ORF Transcript_8719/g.21521 Transcript_8719/m.21521 type:complete len:565 (-) Transcript_8719:145-1839(-)
MMSVPLGMKCDLVETPREVSASDFRRDNCQASKESARTPTAAPAAMPTTSPVELPSDGGADCFVATSVETTADGAAATVTPSSAERFATLVEASSVMRDSTSAYTAACAIVTETSTSTDPALTLSVMAPAVSFTRPVIAALSDESNLDLNRSCFATVNEASVSSSVYVCSRLYPALSVAGHHSYSPISVRVASASAAPTAETILITSALVALHAAEEHRKDGENTLPNARYATSSSLVEVSLLSAAASTALASPPIIFCHSSVPPQAQAYRLSADICSIAAPTEAGSTLAPTARIVKRETMRDASSQPVEHRPCAPRRKEGYLEVDSIAASTAGVATVPHASSSSASSPAATTSAMSSEKSDANFVQSNELQMHFTAAPGSPPRAESGGKLGGTSSAGAPTSAEYCARLSHVNEPISQSPSAWMKSWQPEAQRPPSPIRTGSSASTAATTRGAFTSLAASLASAANSSAYSGGEREKSRQTHRHAPSTTRESGGSSNEEERAAAWASRERLSASVQLSRRNCASCVAASGGKSHSSDCMRRRGRLAKRRGEAAWACERKKERVS